MQRLRGLFSQEEINWAYKILASHATDSDFKENFIITLLEKKKNDENYTIFLDFPRTIEVNLSICKGIIESLKGLKGGSK